MPVRSWGWFKVPGSWPGITDYLQKILRPCLRIRLEDPRVGKRQAAWYQREFTVPDEWAGRRNCNQHRVLNSYAAVFVDGNKAG